MNDYFPAAVNDKLIEIKIKRAYIGLSKLKVKYYNAYWATIENGIFEYYNGKHYKGKRTEAAAQTIFKGLISKYRNFECEGIYYYFNPRDGKWYWKSVD